MIISRVAILLALLSLLIALYGGSSLISALLRSGVVFMVAFTVMFTVQLTLMYVYRKVKEAEQRETEAEETTEVVET